MLLAFSGEPRTANDALTMIDAWEWVKTPLLGSFYRHLKKAVDAGWLQIHDPQARKEGRGRPSRRYLLTGDGVVVLRTALLETQRLLNLAQARLFIGEARL